jgi:serine/threonine protein kinase
MPVSVVEKTAVAQAQAVAEKTAAVQAASGTSAHAVQTAEKVRMMGDYIVGPPLGEGGFSFVKLGTHKDTKEHVALKMLKKDKLNLNSSTKKQVERELAAMVKIQHRNVIRLKHVDWDAKYAKSNGQTLDVILVVLELANGGELFEFLAYTGSFEEAVARTYFHQLMDGVAYCHAQGIAHRDLKPENLLLDGDFVLKLADFGFSNAFVNKQQIMYTECGTPGYMAPEMFASKGYDPQATDIWACGVILFIMLAGFPPFQKPHMSDWWFAKLATNKHALFWQAHSRSAYFSDATKDFINKILNPDPTKRLTIADIKKHPWYTGSTISDATLLQELTRRKNDVDEAKNRQKLEKKQAQAQAGNRDDSLDGDLVRDVMPATPPSLLYGTGREKVHKVKLQEATSLFADASFSISANSFDLSSEKKADEPAEVYNSKDSIACYARFETNSTPRKVIARITAALEDFGGQYTVQDKRYAIRATIVTAAGPVTINAQVFRLTNAADSVHVVEFRRRSGDSIHYRSLYNEIREQLSDLVVVKKAEKTEKASEASVVASAPLVEAVKA